MSGINNISGSPTPPIQHSASQASGPAQLVITTVVQAENHWHTIKSLSQAVDAMAVLTTRAEGGHIDEGTYLLLANALRDVHNTLQERATTQASAADLPRHPPARVWQTPTRIRPRNLTNAVSTNRRGFQIIVGPAGRDIHELAAQQHGIRNSFDITALQIARMREQNQMVSAETLGLAVTAVQQGASVEFAAQQHGIRETNIDDMNVLHIAFYRRGDR